MFGKIERTILEQAMEKTGGNKKQAAEMLHLKRTTFAAKLKSLGAAVSSAGCSRWVLGRIFTGVSATGSWGIAT